MWPLGKDRTFFNTIFWSASGVSLGGSREGAGGGKRAPYCTIKDPEDRGVPYATLCGGEWQQSANWVKYFSQFTEIIMLFFFLHKGDRTAPYMPLWKSLISNFSMQKLFSECLRVYIYFCVCVYCVYFCIALMLKYAENYFIEATVRLSRNSSGIILIYLLPWTTLVQIDSVTCNSSVGAKHQRIYSATRLLALNSTDATIWWASTLTFTLFSFPGNSNFVFEWSQLAVCLCCNFANGKLLRSWYKGVNFSLMCFAPFWNVLHVFTFQSTLYWHFALEV